MTAWQHISSIDRNKLPSIIAVDFNLSVHTWDRTTSQWICQLMICHVCWWHWYCVCFETRVCQKVHGVTVEQMMFDPQITKSVVTCYPSEFIVCTAWWCSRIPSWGIFFDHVHEQLILTFIHEEMIVGPWRCIGVIAETTVCGVNQRPLQNGVCTRY